MDELWEALRSVHVTTDPEASRRKTDQNYAVDLQASQAEGHWQTFYRAVGALERGCGYQPIPGLDTLCKKAVESDAEQFLQILAEEPAMMDIVVILRCVDREAMLHWIEAEMISNVNVLYECLREIFQGGPLPEQAENTAAKGLLQLCGLSPERFQYLLQTGVLFRCDWVEVVRAMLPALTEEGWARLSACAALVGMNERHFQFWSRCADGQDWQTIGPRAEPLLRAWHDALKKATAEGTAWTSLYNEASNLLIGTLLHQIGTPGACERAMKAIIDQTEAAMYQWYESALQQRGTLLAALSQLEHLRFVWLNLGGCAPSAPLCRRALGLIVRWRYLWDLPSAPEVCREIDQLREWLSACQSDGAPQTPGLTPVQDP